ncbi:glutathione peroxidase [Limibacter armeniacum]|uniref:glutathione peroxidase n=1 Tax=Limibacter armeniacum TaxID=466084 RepID=UPI002FE5B773
MRTIITFFVALMLFSACSKVQKSRPEAVETASSETKEASPFYDFTLKSLDGSQDISFEQFKGKKVLLVNVASKCGYTPQYKDLQKLHEMYGNEVVVLGFPANNFMGQEPGSNEEIATFCEKNYGVTFPMFEKISVKGDDQHQLYQWLSSKEKNGWNDEAPSWNFCKYLVNENGELVHFFNSKVEPMGDEIISAIKK